MTPERWQHIKDLVNSALNENPESRTAFLQQSCTDDLPLRLGAEALLALHEDATRKLPEVAVSFAPDQWQRIEQIFQSALELEPAERAAYLQAKCGDDEALRHEIESLLVYQAAAGSMIHGAIHNAAGLLADTTTAKARFTPGTTLNKRYRIIGLLGKGGMGEVYRADDLKLGQPVALKFLTEKLSNDKAMLARFHSEVSMAHRVTHPNVCRVHDIGEVTTSSGNLHFLSMEFVDGEDLSSLLRRIGRLPSDKAVELATQLCAGLAAAHEAGVLHRDLKPANVMIDGKGRVRITDFGLAGFAEQIKGNEVFAGTPAYMSPEQFAGKEVTAKSDIYALGLVLYEIFTGKRVFEGNSLEELRSLHESSSPTNPSNWVKNIDPLVERVILRCLEKDPAKRLSSAKQVADALPGGDPLAAALALGETPSPEMVAASGQKTEMKPMYAVVCLVAIIVSLIVIPFLNRKVNFFERMPSETSPEVLIRKAREINAQLGWTEPPVDTAHGIITNSAAFQQYAKLAKSSADWDKLVNEKRMPYLLWYRESPHYLFSEEYIHKEAKVTPTDPDFNIAGMTYLTLNFLGNLEYFEAIPELLDASPLESTNQVIEPDWKIVFSAAGLDFNKFSSTPQIRAPRSAYDVRRAWTGPHSHQPNVQLHIEAAAYKGRFVFFYLTESERIESLREMQNQRFQPSTEQKIGGLGIVFFMSLVVIGSAWMTRRNLRMNKGDRKGAFRLATFVFVCTVIEKFLNASHIPTANEFDVLMQIIARSSLHGGLSFLVYLALEPYVRKRWPNTLIGWQRLLAGGWRDPLVGRDVLLGMSLSVVFWLFESLISLAGLKFGLPLNLYANFDSMLSFRATAGLIMENFSTVIVPAGIFFLIFMTCVLVRKEWLAASILILIQLVLFTLLSREPWVLAIPFNILISIAIFLVARRFGLLALYIFTFCWIIAEIPFTNNFSMWYANNSNFVLIVLLAIAIYAFRISLGGQKIFTGKLLED